MNYDNLKEEVRCAALTERLPAPFREEGWKFTRAFFTVNGYVVRLESGTGLCANYRCGLCTSYEGFFENLEWIHEAAEAVLG